MTFEEVYQQIRKMHYEILDERESISKSARLSLSTWMLDILTEYRMTIEALEREPSDDLISRAEAIDAIENINWYHQNQNKDMVSGANSDEHQVWYKAQDIYEALEAVPQSVSFENDTKIKSCSKDSDLISRADAIEALGEEPPVWCDEEYEIAERDQWRADIEAIESVPSADRPRGEWIDKEELIDAINDAQFVYDSDEGGHKEYDITELVRVIFKGIISNLSSADMRGENK